MFNDTPYKRNCKDCNHQILMAKDDKGFWQPWELDGSGRHSCNSLISSRLDSSSSSKSSANTAQTVEVITISDQKKTSLTYETKCWWCNHPVFYHTNGYGDCVLFDKLGYPWQIHECWEKYWTTEKEIRSILKKLWEQKHDDFLNAFPQSITNEGFKTCLDYALRHLRHPQQKLSFENNNTKKLLILSGAMRMVNRDRLETTEENVASYMGLTVEKLKQSYPPPYFYTLGGARLMRLEDPTVWLHGTF